MCILPNLGSIVSAPALLLAPGRGVFEHVGFGTTGLWVLLEHALDCILVTALLALCVGIGTKSLDLVGLMPTEEGEDVFASLAVGIGLLGTALLALGAMGGFTPLAMGVVFVAATWLVRDELAGLPRRCQAVARAAIDAVRTERALGAAALLALTGVSIYLLAFASAPPVDWDALMYHLRIPSQFLQRGAVFNPTDSASLGRIGPLHMLYVPLLLVGGPSAPAVLTAALGLALATYLFFFARRLFGDRTALLAVALLWGTTTLIMVASTARVGAALLLFTLGAHASLMPGDDARLELRHVALAGVLLGLGFGVKAPGIIYAAALSPLLLVGMSRWTDFLQRGLVLLATFLGGYLPWLLKDWVLLGSPWAPFRAGPRLLPWLEHLYAKAPVGVKPPLDATPPTPLNGKINVHDLFFDPQRLAVEQDGAYYFTNPTFALLPLAVFFWRRSAVWRLVVPGVVFVGGLLLHSLRPDLRYLLPAVVPFTIVVAYLFTTGLDRLVGASLSRAVALVVSILALLPTGMTVVGWLRGTEALSNLIGRSSNREYVEHHLLATVRSYGLMKDALRRAIPGDGDTVLMMFDGRGYDLGPPVIQDPRLTNWLYLSELVPPDGCLGHPGFSYVLVNTGALGWYERRGVSVAAYRLDAFDRYRKRCLSPIWRGPGYLLFQRNADIPGGSAATRADDPDLAARDHG